MSHIVFTRDDMPNIDTSPSRTNRVVQFYRDYNNFAYAQGAVNFSQDCDNTVVISDQPVTQVSKFINSLIIIRGGSVEVLPLQETNLAINRSLDILAGAHVNYHIPKSVVRREKLDEKNIPLLEHILASEYGIRKPKVSRVKNSLKGNGIFRVEDPSGQYIFKYLGHNINKIEAISEVSASFPDLFPKPRKTLSGKNTIALTDGLYGLEEFLESEPDADRTLKYFSRLGEAIANMHDCLQEFIVHRPELRNVFCSDSKHLSDSNVVSLALDLSLAGFTEVLPELYNLAREEVLNTLNRLPEYIIHGDLNRSNVLVKGELFKFIDLETLKLSKKIFELESPLLFGGNMSIPHYVPGSLKSISQSYNRFAKTPLSSEEISAARNLIIYGLIKNFVVRNIRRGEKSNNLEKIIRNLHCVRSDKKHE